MKHVKSFAEWKLYEAEVADMSADIAKIRSEADLIEACKDKFLIIHSDKDFYQKLDARDKSTSKNIFVIAVKPEKSWVMTMPEYTYEGQIQDLLQGPREDRNSSWGDDKSRTSKIWEMFLYNKKRKNPIFIKEKYIEDSMRSELEKLNKECSDYRQYGMDHIRGERKEGYYSGSRYEFEVTSDIKQKFEKTRKHFSIPSKYVLMARSEVAYILSENSLSKPYVFKNSALPKLEVRAIDTWNFLTYSSYSGHSNDDYAVYNTPGKHVKEADKLFRRAVETGDKIKKLINDWRKYDFRGSNVGTQMGIL